MSKITFAVVTVSDTCFAGTNVDKSGPALKTAILNHFPSAHVIAEVIVPDEKNLVESELRNLRNRKCNVVLTTGGTGFSPRDVTPEATKAVIEREAPGVAYAMISKSLQITDMAMLSRAVCGISGTSLIINLPGSVKGATECFSVVRNAIPHAVALLEGNREAVLNTHAELQTSMESKVKSNNIANRNRSSPYPMVEVKDALRKIRASIEACEETELINIENSLNRVLAEDVVSAQPFPPFAASIKDGYAVITSDGVGKRKVRDVVAAGDDFRDRPLEFGEVIRISTGAPLPLGADAVVQVEDTELVEASSDGCREHMVEIKVAPTLGQDIRQIGSDIPEKTVVLQKYDKISPGHIGILATLGEVVVRVFKRPSIGIISTGNELQRHDEELRPGHIRDCNKLTLLNLLKQHGYEAHDCGIAKDEPNCVKICLANAMSKHDFIITTGGISMGEFDLIKEVLKQDFDAEIIFGRVNMKPGKPTTFAICTYRGSRKIIFGLPGNPVSATVTTLLFVVPALRHMEHSHVEFPILPVVLGETISLDVRPEYRRLKIKKIDDQLIGYSTGNQISSRLNSFVEASVLGMIPGRIPGQLEQLNAGEVIQAYMIDLA